MKRALAVAGFALVGFAAARAGAGLSAREITYLSGERVNAAFAKGMPLVETGSYKVHASRREGPGQVEVHTQDTDIIYVLTGSATLVTGGAIVAGRNTEAEEIRGTSVDGGEAREIGPGDVVIVPNGTPHWFKAVPAPMTYYVVKVRASEAR
jgi:mannose-6-phosphate isomerase-like protein (cupin superfamily)